jgi:hypothetical protein
MRTDAVYCSAKCRAKHKRIRRRIGLGFARRGIRRCIECGRELVIGLDKLRSDRLYCVPNREHKITKSGKVVIFKRSCRQRAYRKRRRLACEEIT